MDRKMPTTAYTEIQIDEDSISLTFITESGSDGAVIEDTERFTFEELQSLSGEHSTLSLSRETRNTLETGALYGDELKSLVEDEEQSPYLPEEGQVLRDDNAATWSDDDRVEVVEVMLDVRADEWSIDDNEALDSKLRREWENTVADANPSYKESEPVVIGRYVGSSKLYAFPLARLRPE